MNFEFQDKKLKKEHLKKYRNYKVHLQCQSGKPVVTVIICTYHIKSRIYVYDETETSLLKPIIEYLTDYYDEVKYLTIKNKINNELKLSLREIQFLVLLPFMTRKKFRLNKVRDVCNLIEEIKDKKLFDDEKYYLILSSKVVKEDEKYYLPLISAIHQWQ